MVAARIASRIASVSILALVLLAACGGDDEPRHGVSRAPLTPRTCTKDVAWLEELMAQTSPPPACAVDSDCACGTHCSTGGSCEADCVTTEHPTYRCPSPSLVCDNWGMCIDPDAPPLPEVAPALRVAPLAVTVPATPPFAGTRLDVTLDHAGISGPAAALAVGGNEERVLVCPGGGTACPNPTVELVRELEVKCAESAPWADDCQLGAPWTWEAGGRGVVATKPIWVRPKSTAQASSWELRISGSGDTANDEAVTIERASNAIQPFDGRYEGQVSLGTNRTLKLDAIASDWGTGEVLLIDPSRTLSPNGKLRLLAAGGSLRFSWLGDANGVMTAELAVGTRTFDAATGTIDATFRLTLPLGGDGRPGTTMTKVLDGHVTLRRIGDNTARACGTNLPACLVGTSCEYLGKCLPGATWQSQVTTLPLDNGLWYPGLESWSQAVRPQLNMLDISPVLSAQPPDAIERLACYESDWTADERKNGVLAPSLLSATGDLRCASNNAPWAARATIREAAGDTMMDVGDLLVACLSDLEQQAPAIAGPLDLPKSSCISLARLLPGLDLALEGALTTHQSSAREATMAQQLIRNWLQVQGFVARQGDDDTDLAGGTGVQPLVSLSRLLDAADAGWKLVLQAPVSETLVSLDPRHLRNPDYRRKALIAMHWPGTTSTDVVAGRQLALAPNCGSMGEANSCDADQTPVIDPLEVDLSGDATVAFRISLEAQRPWSNNRYVVDSPGLAVRMSFGGVPYREKGYVRNGSTYSTVTKTSWWECRKACSISAPCVAWSYESAPAQACKLHSTAGSRTAQSNAFSGVIAVNSHPGSTYADFYLHTFDGEYLAGNELDVVPAATFNACFDLCSQVNNCAAFTFAGGSCYRKTATGWMRSIPGPQSAVMPTVGFDVSHLTTTGKAETVKLVVPRDKLGDRLLFDRKVVITRNSADSYYRLYIDGVLASQARYYQQPGRWAGRYRIGRRDEITSGTNVQLAEFEAAEEVGFWTTTLDDVEINSIYTRSQSLIQNYLSRGTLTLSDSADQDQPVGLPVTLLETLDSYHQLLERKVDDIAGESYAVCRGADPGTVEAAQARIGDGLRRSLLTELLAGDIEHRAREVECDSDAQCTGYGATCGARASHRIPALGPAVTRTGTMQTCYGPGDPDTGAFSQGLCGNASGLVTVPGTVATATFSVTVTKEADYAVWGRFFAQANRQSFFVRVDAQPWQSWSTGLSSLAARRLHWARYSGTGAIVHLLPGTHTITLGVREPGTIVAELALAESSITLAPEQRHDVCVKDGAPVEMEVPWQLQLDRARTQVTASRERLEQRLAQLASCEPPMGLAELDAPLFFTDPGAGAFDRYFAASNYLLNPADGLALTAVSTALTELTTTSSALDQARDDDYHSNLDADEHQARLAAIRQQYDSQLGQLCGPANAPFGGMLAAISGNSVNEDVCFVAQTTECLANAHRPVRDAQASCYSGALGESLLSLKATSIDVEFARLDWNARQNELDRKGGFCAELEATGDMITEHNAYMEKLRRKKAWYDTIASVVGIGAAISTGGVSSLLATKNAAELPEWGVELGEASAFLSAFSSSVSLLGSLLGAGAEDIEAERQKWEEVMQARANQLDVIQCWNEAAGIRDQIKLAQNRIERATADFELALMRMSNARREVHRLVDAGNAELAREGDRMLVRPQHHYWLDDRITQYRNTFAWAKRTTYLAVRAIEHDFQRSTGLAQAVLDAKNPFQLDVVLDQLHATYANARVWDKLPQPGRAIIRLSDQIGIAPGTLGDYLATDAALIRDKNGAAIGRGVRFSFRPETVPTGLSDRRAERLWGMTGSVQVDGEFPDSTIAFSLFKQAMFFSRWFDTAPAAGGAKYQVGIHRPSQNLFAPDANGMSNFAEALQFQPSTIHNLKNISDVDLFQGEYPAVTVNDFAGQGLYGDYVVMFTTSGNDAIDLDHVEDVLLRFDYVSIVGGSTPSP